MRKHHRFAPQAMGLVSIAALVLQFFVPLTAVHADTLPTETQTKAVSTNLGIFGGDTWDIAVDGNHVYTIASGVPNGFFYSSNAAATWQRPAGSYDYGSGTAVEVDTSSRAVYVSLGGGLYKSTDFGATLTKISDFAGFALLFAQGKLLTAENDTVYVSADGGATFTHTSISGDAIMSFAASATSGTFYAVTKNASSGVTKLNISTDSGATWSVVSVDAGVTPYTMVNANPYNANILTLSGDNDLWLSTNAGLSWSKMGVSPARSCSDFSIWTTTRWYACAGYSTDNGASWTDMDMHTNVMRGPGKSVVINPSDETVLYGDCMSGVCKSTDGGLTWNNSLDGITGVNVRAISQTTNKSTVWIASSNGLGKTNNFTDAVPDWTWPILPCDHSSRCDASGIGQSVWVKPDNANYVLAGSIGGWIYRSTDAGATWVAQVPSVVDTAKFKTGSWNNLTPSQFIHDPLNSSTVYVAMTDPTDHLGAVLQSTDAGSTWTNLNITGDAPATVMSMSKTGVLYVGTGEGKSTSNTKGVFKYVDGTWTKLTGIDTRLNIMSVMVDPETQTTVYATASNDLAPLQIDGFYKSTDSGASWSKVVPGGYHGFGAITVEKSTAPNTLYVSAVDNANHGVLLKSSDVGATWGTLYTGLKSESFTTVLFDGLLAGNKHGFFSLKSKGAVTATQSLTSVRKRALKIITLSATLKDATTKKILKSKSIEIWVKTGKTWVFKGANKTNAKGVVNFKVKPSVTTQYQLRWKPAKADQAEYAASTSKTMTVTVKK